MDYDTFLFAGHGKSEVTGAYDPGAVSNGVRENDIANKILDAALGYLKNTGLSIHRDENNYTDDDLKGNTYKYKCGLIIHVNAGGGTGCEIYVPAKEKYLTQDFTLVSNISTILGNNRGVKSRNYNTDAINYRTNNIALNYTDYYKEIREAWSKGISASLLEVGFIDNPNDLNIMLSNIDKIGYYCANWIASCCDKTISLTSQIYQDKVYTVLPGDTLYRIGRKLNKTVDYLVKKNNIQDKNLIKVGQKITY